MKDDIRPMSEDDPESPKYRPPFLDDDKKASRDKDSTDDRKSKDDKKSKSDKKTKDKPKPPSKPKKPTLDSIEKRRRREQVKKQEELNHRPDLTFFWGMIIFVVFGSLVALGYVAYSKNQKQEQEVIKKPAEERQAEGENQAQINENLFYYLSSGQEKATIYRADYQQKETVVKFTPPAETGEINADWDGDHRFAYINDEGVRLYNANKKESSILAPNRGVRQYFKVKFSRDGKIATIYTKGDKNYLEVYSSSLKLLNKRVEASDFAWTKENNLSYFLVDKENKKVDLKIYDSDSNKYKSYLSDFINKSRYPIALAHSPTSKKIALLLRDNTGSRSEITLSISDVKREGLNKLGEVLYLKKEVEDSQIVNPTLVFDKKEDYIYVSLNKQMFKAKITTGEITEIDLGFEGTIESLKDNKYLYIRKSDGSNEDIDKPESLIIYDRGEEKIKYNSPLSRIIKLVGY